MSNPSGWRPAERAERLKAIDVLRGIALFGVLMVNLETLFRVSLFQHILEFHTHPGVANRVADLLVSGVLEFKAFTLFCVLFGVGVAIQAERAAARGVNVPLFLARRFLVLLVFGLCHLFLVWNGDILALYAVCGLLLTPLLKLPWRALLLAGAIVIVLPYFAPIGMALPDGMRVHAADANRIYGQGSFGQIAVFRFEEAWVWIVPLLVDTLPRTLGVMIWGVAAWRSGLLRNLKQHRSALGVTCLVAGLIGGGLTAVRMIARSGGRHLAFLGLDLELCSTIPLAAAYASGLSLWLSSKRGVSLPALAATGRMALTNYLMESVILSCLFYSYGLGWFGRLGSAAGAAIGVALYVAQVYFSRCWLERFQFGPFEWLWRSLTYGRRQPMRLG